MHDVGVLFLTALAAPMLFQDSDIFNFAGWGAWIAVAYGYLLLVVVGSPWSLLWFALNAGGTSEAVSEVLFLPLVLGGAWFNVVLHHCWRRRHLRTAALRARPTLSAK